MVARSVVKSRRAHASNPISSSHSEANNIGRRLTDKNHEQGRELLSLTSP